MAIDGEAVLLRGPSGAGKSDLGLRLIDRGARLVADDQTLLRRVGPGDRWCAPPPIAGLIEVRGIGIVTGRAADAAPLALIADLAPFGSGRADAGTARSERAGCRRPARAWADGGGFDRFGTRWRPNACRLVVPVVESAAPMARRSRSAPTRAPAALPPAPSPASSAPARERAVLFIDCDDERLERRYTETRRPHPLAGDRSIMDGIRRTPSGFCPARPRGLVIDTSTATPI